MTAGTLAHELEVSVRTVYRDIEALNAAGVPVWAESGPGGGCQLVDGYRTPLTSLSRDEALAILTLGTPGPLGQLGLAPALESARRRLQDASGLAADDVTVHLDMPRWFSSQEDVTHLPALATAVRERRRIDLTYESKASTRHRGLAPLGLVNKAGSWYVVVCGTRGPFALRVARLTALRVGDEAFDRPTDFDLPRWWAEWSGSFEASRPRLDVVVRASPDAIDDMPEIFGPSFEAVLAAATPVDDGGWRELHLTFEHEAAALGRLAGFGGTIDVVSPTSLRERLVETATSILHRYGRRT